MKKLISKDEYGIFADKSTNETLAPKHGVTVESHPRTCIIVGSSNRDTGFLRDITGNRRFWPVMVTGKGKHHPWELTEVDQIWAEAVTRYNEGEELFLKGEIAAEAVIIHHIIAKGTIDEKIMVALKNKDKTQSALIDAVKAVLGGRV